MWAFSQPNLQWAYLYSVPVLIFTALGDARRDRDMALVGDVVKASLYTWAQADTP